jgi:GNAT superfamily N-acetyltransferase
LNIRPAVESDWPGIWRITKEVIAGGDTYVFDPRTPEAEMRPFWFAADRRTYLAELDGRVVAAFWLKPNQPALGSHVCNAAYMVAPDAHGRGIGRRIGEWSLDEASRLGFTAMQFNFVVASNTAAVRLWQRIGMEIIGTIPDAFNHVRNGPTDAYVMYRKL